MGKTIFTVLICISILSCNDQSKDQKAEAQKLMELSREWAKAPPEDKVNYWDEDAIVLPPGQPSVRGKSEIREMIEATSGIPGFEVNWEPHEVYVSKCGDLAYMIERNYIVSPDSLGKLVKNFNNAVTVWKKQEDGTWKNVVDIWNSDPSMKSIK